MGYKKVCLDCRKAYNQNSDFQIQSGMNCPECGQKMTEVNHKFRPPKRSDLKAWNVTKYLFQEGFLYQHIYSTLEEKNVLGTKEKYVAYPTKMNDAIQFVADYKDQALTE